MSASLRNNVVNVGPKLGGLSLKQLTLGWIQADKCAKLRIFKLEVNNIFQTQNINQADSIQNHKELARQVTPTIHRNPKKAQQETCNQEDNLFKMLNNKPQHYEIICNYNTLN